MVNNNSQMQWQYKIACDLDGKFASLFLFGIYFWQNRKIDWNSSETPRKRRQTDNKQQTDGGTEKHVLTCSNMFWHRQQTPDGQFMHEHRKQTADGREKWGNIEKIKF